MIGDVRSPLDRIRQEIERTALRARNGIKLAAGLSQPSVGVTPRDPVWRNGRAQLFRYRNDDVRYRPPLLIVFSLVSRAYILDLMPGNSFVERLRDAGFDVYLLDWGEPDERDAGNRLEYYVDGVIPAAVREVRRRSGCDEVNLLGYCFGGDLGLMYAAHHPDAPLRSLTVVACPVDFGEMGHLGRIFGGDSLDLDSVLDEDGNVPAGVVLSAFRSIQPTAEVTGYVNLFERLWSDDYVRAHQAMTGWATNHIPFPGATARQMRTLVRENAFVNDRLVIGGDRVHLSDVRAPLLAVLGEKDHIVPEAAAAPVLDLVGSDDKTELRLDGGHIGLVVGKSAATNTIPTILEFLTQRSEPAGCLSRGS